MTPQSGRHWLGAYGAAKRFYAAALDLTPPDDPDRPTLLLRLGQILRHTEVGGNTAEVLSEARDGLIATGDSAAAAEAEVLLGYVFRMRGMRDEAFGHFANAEALVRDLPLSASKANVIAGISAFLWLAGEAERAIPLAREALEAATELGLDELRARSLDVLGGARFWHGDLGGLDDLKESIEISLETNSVGSVTAYSNLAVCTLGISASWSNRSRCTPKPGGWPSDSAWAR